MPQLRDITVRVTDADYNDFEEWGVQQLRNQHKISAYIKSTSNMVFRVTVQAKLPYGLNDFPPNDSESLEIDTETSMYAGSQCSSQTKRSSSLESRSSSKWSTTNSILRHSRSSEKQTRVGSATGKASFSSPIKHRVDHYKQASPPFHFLASLFLDGRAKAERRVIVYLDPEHVDFPPEGKAKFRNRWIQARDGTVTENSWVFKDLGVETVFKRLLIKGTRDSPEEVEETSEDSITSAMTSTGLRAEDPARPEEKSGLGKIVVVVERITLGEKWNERNYRARHQKGEAEDIDMGVVQSEITHTAGLAQTATLQPQGVNVVHYSPYIEGEPAFATFQFFYRSEETLEKFNFPGFSRPSKRKRLVHTHREFDNKMANMTPLSIAYPIQSSKHLVTTYEQRNNGRLLKSKEKPKNKSKHTDRVAVVVQKDRPFTSYAEHEKLRTQLSTIDMAVGSSLDSSSHKEHELLLSWLSEPEQLKNYYHLTRLLAAPSSFPSTSPETDSPQDTTSIQSMWSGDALAIRTRGSGISSSKFAKKNSVSAANLYAADTTSVVGTSRTTMYTHEAVFKKHCHPNDESDADDEHENSVLGNKSFNHCHSDELSIRNNDNDNQDQYDQNLHADFREITISKKRRLREDGVDDKSGSRCKKEINAPSDSADNASEKSAGSRFSRTVIKEGSLTGHSSISSRDTPDDVTASKAETQALETTVKKENQYFMHKQAKRVKT